MTDEPLFKPVREILAIESGATHALEYILNAIPQAKLDKKPAGAWKTEVYASLPDYAAFVVSSPEWLDSELIQHTEVTPIVYIASQENIDKIVKKEEGEGLDEAIERAMSEHNLSGIARIDDLPASTVLLEKVTAQKMDLARMIGALPRNIVKQILEQERSKPHFKELLKQIQAEYEEHERMVRLIVPENPENRPFVLDALTVRTFLEWDTYPPQSPLKKEVEKQLTRYLVEYVKQVQAGKRTDGRLGESVSGEEGSLGRLERLPHYQKRTSYAKDLRWKILRIIGDDTAGNDHKDIAKQRYLDAKNLSEKAGYVTPLMTLPVHLDANGFPLSVTLQQDVEGPTLEKVFQSIEQDLERVKKELPDTKDKSELEKRRELLLKLREEIVKTYIDRVAQFQNAGVKTFTKKPKGNDVMELYKGRLADFYDLFNILAPSLFSEEEAYAYLEGLNALDDVDVSPENIVRVRDAALPNAAIRFDKVKYDGVDIVFSIDDVVENTTTDGKVDIPKLREKFYDIDIHYRWGHILEDISHIFSARETAFLVSEGKEKGYKVLRKHLRNFLDEIERPDLNKDKVSAFLMSFYRSARKMKLFATRYIRNAYDEWQSGIISKAVYDRRRRDFHDAVDHHARSCYYILRNMREALQTNGLRSNANDRVTVDTWYAEARKDFNPETAKPFVEKLDQLKEKGRLYARVSALALTYRKLRDYLSNKRNQLNFEGLWGDGTN